MPRIHNESVRLPLAEFDLAVVRERGLSEATVRQNELRTDGDALVLSYCSLDGSRNCFARRRPHNPRVNAEGKPIKYEQPPGTPNRPYFPVGSLESLRRPGDEVHITEGEFKALKLSQEGFPAIGLSGVYGWKPKGKEELCDGLKEINWTGRAVYVVFDFDEKPKTRSYVNRARARLADLLRAAGAAEVYAVELPPGNGGGKQGVDDFIVANDNDIEAYRKLVAAAKPVLSQSPVPSIKEASGRTEHANAKRLVDRFGSDIRWVGPWDKWLIWDGQRWAMDQELKIQGMAKEVAAALWKELGAAAQDVDRDTRSAMFAFARNSNNKAGIENMVALARSEPGVAISVGELDQGPWLFNVLNGTLDLQTGRLREHSRSDFITKLAPVTLDPDAICPIWSKFLEVIFAGDVELIAFMQRLTGYSLTGVIREHILPFMHGVGANGKSTFFESLMKLLGMDYGMKAAPDLLMAKRGESHPTERADLHGKRLVGCIETEAGRRMAESLMKELTGGDRVRARRMREDFWEFVPTHHIWLASNHKPVVTGTDHGIWRRIKLIPFNVVIPKKEQDTELPIKLEAELSGILNWALAGCLDWQKGGLQEPECVQAATKGYAEEMDDIGNFLKQNCELGDAFAVPATMLFNAFAEATGSKISQKMFGAELTKRGFANKRMTSGPNKARIAWYGLRLISDDNLPEGFFNKVAGADSPLAKRMAAIARGG